MVDTSSEASEPAERVRADDQKADLTVDERAQQVEEVLIHRGTRRAADSAPRPDLQHPLCNRQACPIGGILAVVGRQRGIHAHLNPMPPLGCGRHRAIIAANGHHCDVSGTPS
jgi:hypothetical protein